MTHEVGRLALRVEGDNWVAYYARQGTMEGAAFLGSIRMALVVDRGRKEAFQNLMTNCVGDILKSKTGQNVTWGAPTTAPENERSGRA